MCSLQLDAHLAREDRSWPQIAEQLALAPVERVERLSSTTALRGQLELLSRTGAPAIVIGQAAGALHGWPLALSDEPLELCARADGAGKVLDALQADSRGAETSDTDEPPVIVLTPPGTAGFGDLARGAVAAELDGGEVRVAGLLDLLRIADASPNPGARRHAFAYRAVLDVLRAGRDAAPAAECSDAERITEWFGRQSPVA